MDKYISLLKNNKTIVISLLLLIFLIFSYPIDLNYRSYAFDLRLEATGEKNELSKGSEVWVLGIEADNKKNDSTYNQVREDSNWIERNGKAVAVNYPANFSRKINCNSTELSIEFLRHSYSGKVKMYLDDIFVTTVDLYANEDTYGVSETIDLSKHLYSHSVFSGIIKIIIKLAFLFLLIYGIFSYLISSSFRNEVSKLLTRFNWLKYGVPSFVVYCIFLGIYYPALMSSDSIYQWGQMNGVIDLNDGNPPIHTFLNWIVTRFWNSPTAIALFQIILFSVIIAYGIKLLEKLNLKKNYLWVIAFLFALYPCNGIMVNLLWKDVIYAVLLFLMTIFFLRIIMSKGEILKDNKFWKGITIIGIIIGLFSTNGLFTALFTILSIAIFFRSYLKQAAISAAVVLGMFFFMTFAVYNMIGVKKEHLGNQDLVQLIGGYVNSGAPLPKEAHKYYDSILPLSQWTYDSQNSDALLFGSPHGNFLDVITNNKKLASSTARSFIFGHPILFLQDRIEGSRIIWQISNKNTYTFKFDENIPSLDFFSKEEFEFESDSMFPIIKNSLTQYLNSDSASLLWRPALFLYLTILLLILYMVTIKNKKVMLLLAPVFWQSVVLFTVCSQQSFRFQYAVVLVGLFLIPLLAILIINKQKLTQSK